MEHPARPPPALLNLASVRSPWSLDAQWEVQWEGSEQPWLPGLPLPWMAGVSGSLRLTKYGEPPF